MKPSTFPPLVAALALAAPLAVRAGSAALPTTATVPISHFQFQMPNVSIPAGGSVTWKNLDGEPHTVTATDGAFRSGALDQGESFTFRFAKPGVYSYLCSIHPQMRATVTVR